MSAFLGDLGVPGWLELELARADDPIERAGTLARLFSADNAQDRRALLHRTLACDAPADRIARWLRHAPLDWDAVEQAALERLPLPRDPLGARTQRDRLECVLWSLRQADHGHRLAAALADVDARPCGASVSTARLSAVAWQHPHAWWGVRSQA